MNASSRPVFASTMRPADFMRALEIEPEMTLQEAESVMREASAAGLSTGDETLDVDALLMGVWS